MKKFFLITVLALSFDVMMVNLQGIEGKLTPETWYTSYVRDLQPNQKQLIGAYLYYYILGLDADNSASKTAPPALVTAAQQVKNEAMYASDDALILGNYHVQAIAEEGTYYNKEYRDRDTIASYYAQLYDDTIIKDTKIPSGPDAGLLWPKPEELNKTLKPLITYDAQNNCLRSQSKLVAPACVGKGT